jgi:pimeloyl-ACP methyl ester carboxylesterase
LTASGIRDEYRLDRQFSHECASEVGPTLRYYNTVNTARDMDQIRQAVGDDVMNYLGFSYGTELGWTYAHLFPQEVHTFVLDGVVDPTQIHNENSIAQLKGFEEAFGQFANWCVKAPVCADLHDPAATAEHLFASTQQTPLATGTPRKLTSSLASTGVLEALYSKSEWPKLADALTTATRGNGAGLLQLADKYNQRSADGTYQNIIDANATISCNDTAAHKPPSVAKVLARSKVLAKRFPIFAGTGGGSGASCLGWQPHRTPIPPPTAATPKPVLVIGNLHDPATPYAGAVHLAAEMGNAQLLSWDGEGHTSYLNGSSCIDRYVNDYLIHSTLPPKGKVCPAK